MAQTHPEQPGALRRISDAVGHALDALHITHHQEKPVYPACKLADALLAKVQQDMGASWTAAEEQFCDPPCLQRDLRARGMDVG